MLIVKKTRNLIFASVTSLVLVGAMSISPAMAETRPTPLLGMLQPGAPVSFADLIERVSPAVVSINVVIREQSPTANLGAMEGVPDELREWLERQMPGLNQRPNPAPREGRSLGSGFLITDDGYIVTNHHVINRATEITVSFADGKEFEAELIGSDQRTDLAVLKIDGKKKFTHVKFADKVKVRVGDWVVAVGNPYGLGGTATAGIVSATGREIGGSAYDFLQVDASINRGNSGGPTFDLYGNVIGVNSQILSPSGGNIGIGFAVPASLASKITKELIEKGSVTRGWLGVSVQSVDQDLAESQGLARSRGALVASVVKDSPAEKAGFKDGDIILKLDGADIEDQRDLTRRVGDLFVGHKANFSIVRNGKSKNIRVNIGKRDDNALENPKPESKAEVKNEFGLYLDGLNADDREKLGISDDRGVAIRRVEPGSQAARKGFRAGDAIISANNMDVFSPEDFDRAVKKARERGLKAIRLLIRTQRGQTYTALRLDKK